MIASRWRFSGWAGWHRSFRAMALVACGLLLVTPGCEKPPATPQPRGVKGSKLHYAAQYGNLQTIQRLINEGADVNEALPETGQTPLILAATRNQTKLVQFLLDEDIGLDLERTDNDGQTALAAASGMGTDDCVELLLAAGADMESRDKWGRTPLMLAASNGYPSTLSILLSGGADSLVIDDEGLTALVWAARADYPACVELLLEEGEELEAYNLNDMTILMIASERGAANSVALLITKGADVQTTTEEGMTALHYAAFSDNRYIVESLIDAGAVVDARDADEKTPLMIASKNIGRCISIFVEAGADVNARSSLGSTPLMMAIATDKPEWSFAYSALIRHGADVNAILFESITPLMMAAMMSKVNVVQDLLDAGADVHYTSLFDDLTVIDAVRDTRNEIADREEILAILLEAAQNSSKN